MNPFVKGQEFLVDLNDHNSVVNCVRFSPCGKMLASTSDRQIIIYTGNSIMYSVKVYIDVCRLLFDASNFLSFVIPLAVPSKIKIPLLLLFY